MRDGQFPRSIFFETNGINRSPHSHGMPPQRRARPPQCDSHLHSVGTPVRGTALAHLQGSVHSVQRCTLNGQRAPHARRGSAHFLEKREPLALGS